MTSTPALQQILWIIMSIIGTGTMIAVAVVLLPRTRGVVPWLMLGSGIVSLFSSVGSQILFMTIDWNNPGFPQLPLLLSATSSLAWLLYLAGVMMLAFQHRSLISRVGELEAILRDLSSRES